MTCALLKFKLSVRVVLGSDFFKIFYKYSDSFSYAFHFSSVLNHFVTFSVLNF